MPLSFILHPPAEQMFISDAADEGGRAAHSQTHAETSAICIFFVVLSHFPSRGGRLGAAWCSAVVLRCFSDGDDTNVWSDLRVFLGFLFSTQLMGLLCQL